MKQPKPGVWRCRSLSVGLSLHQHGSWSGLWDLRGSEDPSGNLDRPVSGRPSAGGQAADRSLEEHQTPVGGESVRWTAAWCVLRTSELVLKMAANTNTPEVSPMGRWFKVSSLRRFLLLSFHLRWRAIMLIISVQFVCLWKGSFVFTVIDNKNLDKKWCQT